MDAMKFIEECDRMCKTFDECHDGCPAYDGKCLRCNDKWDKSSSLSLNSGRRSTSAKHGRAYFWSNIQMSGLIQMT